MKPIILSLISFVFFLGSNAQNYCNGLPQNIYSTISVQECLTLINDNINNPNFVILDVRTPGEHIPQHLEGAININLYDTDFADKLNLLNKEKTYLVHCKSGGRSTNAFNQMKDAGFREVYNMSGGMNSWNSMGYPTTSEFAPELGIYECSFIVDDTVNINEPDTINIILTNAANDTLIINSLFSTNEEYFNCNFPESIKLSGGQDYSIEIVFFSNLEITGQTSLTIETNAGDKEIVLKRTSTTSTYENLLKQLTFNLYPNPVGDKLFIDLPADFNAWGFKIYDTEGRLIMSNNFENRFVELNGMESGLYLFMVQTDKEYLSKRFIKE